jgi:hypothetical protein
MVKQPEAPSSSKLELIRRFLRLNGTQAEIDDGGFVQRYGLAGGPLVPLVLGQVADPISPMRAAMDALNIAYQKRRDVWQEEYENHVNGEFTEQELQQIVAFLEGEVGQHFLHGRWRMNAYVSTNTEYLIEQIIEEARASLPPDASAP